jgi:regulator of sigma E protease
MALPPLVVTILNLLLVIGGFGLIIFVHELGHFLAARWAGIRVLGFAIGFGPALISYRKGMGVRRGSSDRDYFALVTDAQGPEGERRERARALLSGAVSPTEYRLNVLPFGGYVKMLGQEDLNPGAVSAASDSYQSTKPWKRMVVISAGVVMNAVTAAILFVVVFMLGYDTEPARIGEVAPGSPAAKAVAINADRLGVTEPGLRGGDTVVRVNDGRPDDFSDLALASAMSPRGRAVLLTVEREGVSEPLEFAVMPEVGPLSGLLEMGISPMRSAMIADIPAGPARENFDAYMASIGLAGVEPGMTLVSAGGRPVRSAHDLTSAVRASEGRPVALEFEKDGQRLGATLEPRPELEVDSVPGREPGSIRLVEHILGLTPVMKAGSIAPEGEGKLEAGDVFARLGEVEFPSIGAGMDEIQRHRGRTIEVVAWNGLADGRYTTEKASRPAVNSKGRIGFGAGDTGAENTLLSLPPASLTPLVNKAEPYTPAAARVISSPGMRILSVAGLPVGNFAELRSALLAATGAAFAAGDTQASVALELELPLGTGPDSSPRPTERTDWTLERADLERLHSLGWESPLDLFVFDPVQTELKASSPGAAVVMGLRKSHQVMLSTYVTFARLFQGTVKIEHLKGPVGIAQLGTLFAERGWVWLLFFMALVSINLAVINFLPLPIVDGGQFLFLLYEQFSGRRVPDAVQSIATLAGLVLIGAVFLLVTFNDIKNLFVG